MALGSAGFAACKGEVRSPDAALSAVAPPVVCGAQRTTAVTVSGSGLTPLPIGTLTSTPSVELPQILLQLRTGADGSAGAGEELAVPDAAGTADDHVRWLSAEQMAFDVYPTLQSGQPLTSGLYDVTVKNPDGRRAAREGSLAVVAAPMLRLAEPVPLCNAQDAVAIKLTGAGFLQIDGALPTVRFGAPDGGGQPVELTATAAEGCAPLPAPTGVALQACTGMTVQAPKGTLAAGSYRVTLRNPKDAGCETQEDVRLAVVPPPTVSEIVNAAVCTRQADTSVILSGAGFLSITEGGATRTPEVTLNGMSFLAVVDNCQPVPDAPGAQTCTTLRVLLPKGSLGPGTYPLSIRNPAPAACSLEMMLSIQAFDPPTLTGVMPTSICSGGGTINLTGDGFRSGATVTIGAVDSSRVTVASPQSATADMPGPIAPSATSYDVTFRNIDGCFATLPQAMKVTPGPAILFVDPPAVPNAVSIQATVYASGVSPSAQYVEISPAGKNSYVRLSFTTVPSAPNRVLVVIPPGLAAGSYDMRLGDGTACPAFLAGALKIVATPTLTVTSVVPGFGTTAQDTAVLVSGAGFVSTPRVYLNPTGNPMGSRAQALAAVTFQSAMSLSGVVRAGLTPGTYDALVVNPDGSYGLKTAAFKVTAADAPPPVISSVSPASVVSGTSTALTILGSGFRAPAATLSCFDAGGGVSGGASISVTASTATSVSVSAVGTGAYCIVRVTNGDGTFFDYSAIGVTNSSLNLTGFKASSSMTVARRALGAIAGRPTAVTRFVYAIGGDNGADSGALASVEAAPTGLDGTLGKFAALSQPLPAPRSFPGVAGVGRFLYSVGGFDGTKAAREVYRAELLSPLAGPQVADVDVVFDPSVGLAAGQYIYRVSAVLSSDAAVEPSNPGGETLAGDFFPIVLPKLSGKLQPVLTWTRAPTATAYRIYRSVKAGDAAGTERLLATVPATAVPLQYVDKGDGTPAGAAPLPLGSTGTWRSIAPLGTARIGAAVAAAQDPTDKSKWYLYAAGGNSGTLAAPAALSSVELLSITVAADGGQSFGAWTAAASSLGAPRWAAPAIAATNALSSRVNAGTTYLYVSSGSSAGVTAVEDRIDAAVVQAGGQLAAFVDARSPGGGAKRAGAGGLLVNNILMAFGGFQGTAGTSSSVSASLKANPPSLENFNNFGSGSLSTARALQGTAIESAFIYQLGGATGAGTNTAQATTEQTIW